MDTTVNQAVRNQKVQKHEINKLNPDGDCSGQRSIKQGEVEHKHGDFILRFYRRFVCGGDALTTLRKVSRKRLELARLKLSDDIEANCLLAQISAYEHAIDFFGNMDVVSEKQLQQVHRQLVGNKKTAAGFRTTQNWIGPAPSGTPLKKALKSASYIPPAPDKIPELMFQWCQQAGNLQQLSIAQIIALYTNMLLIHPFGDGNGRIARTFCEGMLHKTGRRVPALDLRRLHIVPQTFFNALYPLDGVYSPEQLDDYWQSAIEFSYQLMQDANGLLQQCEKSLRQRLILSNPGKLELDVIKHLLEQPFLEPFSYQFKQQITPVTLRDALNKLVTAGILQPQLTPNHQNWHWL